VLNNHSHIGGPALRVEFRPFALANEHRAPKDEDEEAIMSASAPSEEEKKACLGDQAVVALKHALSRCAMAFSSPPYVLAWFAASTCTLRVNVWLISTRRLGFCLS